MEKYTRHVFRSFAARSLKANKTRTIVTIIGIVLSMALFTAVIEGAFSGIRFLVDSEIEAEGKWNGEFYEINDEQVEQLIRSGEIDEFACMERVGWGPVESSDEDKPYLLVESFTDRFEELVAVHILEGRMPENNKEIIIPNHLKADGKPVYGIGDTLTLDLGERYLNGEKVSLDTAFSKEEEEIIKDTVLHEYTVVGIFSRFNMNIEPYNCPGYMALTRGPLGQTSSGDVGKTSMFFTMKNMRNYYRFVDEQTIEPHRISTHSDLLYFNGVSGNKGIMAMITSLVIILIALILIGSISLIYNSFSISVNERTRQFGILKSIGATRKQLRSAVLFEALILSGIGIIAGAVVGCAGIGLTLYFLSGTFTQLLTFSDTVTMHLVINPLGLLAAAVICLITVLVSAWIPARRAMKVSAIEAIRQNQEVKINGRKIKTLKLTQKLFGIEGTLAAKNFKRNKKKSRSVVLSLTLSIILFISASSFCAYLMDSIDNFTSLDQGYDLEVAARYPWKSEEEMLKDLKAIEGVNDIVYTRWLLTNCDYADNILTDGCLQYAPITPNDNNTSGIPTFIYFLSDGAFKDLCEANNLNAEKYYDSQAPLALLQNNVSYYSYDEGKGYTRYYNVDIVKDDVKDLETVFTQYEYVDESEKSEEYQPEVVSKDTLKADCILNNGSYYIPNIMPCFIYPYSMMDVIIQKDTEEASQLEAPSYYILTDDHAGVAEVIRKYGEDNGIGLEVFDTAEGFEAVRMLVMIMNVFAYGFIILISLIAVANVFNTISTNIGLRRREFAMLKSMGLSNKGFRKMMNYECIIYGFRGIIWGLIISVVMTFFMYMAVNASRETAFYIPWYSLVIAIGSVFLVVFLAMWYSAGKIKKDNTIDALKNENL